MFAFACGRKCFRGAKEGPGKKIHCFCEYIQFLKVMKSGGMFQCKVKYIYRKCCGYNILCNFASTNGKDCDLDSISMNNLILKHMGEWKNSKEQKNWSSRL